MPVSGAEDQSVLAVADKEIIEYLEELEKVGNLDFPFSKDNFSNFRL